MGVSDFVVLAKTFKVMKDQIPLWKHIKKFQRLLIQVDIQLTRLSANIIEFEQEVHKLLLRGSIPPETFRRWVKEAKQVEEQASHALQFPKERNGRRSLDHKTLRHLHSHIIHLLQNSPCRDGRPYDKLIHRRETARGSVSPTKIPVVSAENLTSEMCLPVKKTKSEQLLGYEAARVADSVKPSGGEIKQAEPISLCLDEEMAKIRDQGNPQEELISLQEDEPMSYQDMTMGGMTNPEQESILSMGDLKEEPPSPSSESKDELQRQSDDILTSFNLARELAFNNETKIEETEILSTNLIDASTEDSNAGGMSLSERVQEQHEATQFSETLPISLTDASERESNADAMSLSERVEEQRESTQFSEILPISLTDASERESNAGEMSENIQEQHEATRLHETEIASMPATPSEMEGNPPLEPLKIEPIASVSEGSVKENIQELSPGSILPLLSEVEPEAEEGQTTRELNMSLDSNFLVEVSVEGELSNYMDLIFETSHGFWSSKGKKAMNEFKYCNFTSEADNYGILKREKTVKMEVDQSKALEGDTSSSEVPDSSKNPSIKFPEHLILKSMSAMLTSPPEEKWKQTGVMVLRDSAFPSLPQKPDCPNLVILFLQRNRCLREIPQSFFSFMDPLRVVDLSDNRWSCLPPSLFLLDKLQVLILRNCKFLVELPDGIKELKHLEVLDLSGTELNKVPDGIGHLTRLRKLDLTFYGTDDESEYIHLPRGFLSHGILSKLQSLEALSIVVHPEDIRWIRTAEAIMQDVGNLNWLCYLEFYFPRVEILKKFIETSPSWPKISFYKFKFVVGKNVKRFADRVPTDVEIQFNKQKRCLRFVNGEDAPQAVKEVLKRVTAFYLDHHQVIQSLSELGITTSKEIKFCIVRECPNVEVIIRDVGNVEPAYPSLEHMGMHYLWKLKSISIEPLPQGSFCSLKSLAVHTCPSLEFILYESMLQFLHNLEELVVEDCESVKEIIREIDGEVNDCISALPPKLSKIKLYYLPQLLTLWWKLEANSEDPVLNPVRVVTVYSCPNLDFGLLQSIATDVRVLDSETVFQNSDAACSDVEEQS